MVKAATNKVQRTDEQITEMQQITNIHPAGLIPATYQISAI
jgi:hypothetical protein